MEAMVDNNRAKVALGELIERARRAGGHKTKKEAVKSVLTTRLPRKSLRGVVCGTARAGTALGLRTRIIHSVLGVQSVCVLRVGLAKSSGEPAEARRFVPGGVDRVFRLAFRCRRRSGPFAG